MAIKNQQKQRGYPVCQGRLGKTLMSQSEIYLGRQPILNSAQSVIAYELLFRSGQVSAAGVTNDLQATATVIVNTISNIGIENVLDQHSGFINVSYDLLMSDMLELLPRERIVLELLETVTIDDQVIARCRDLKSKGFRLALDDFEYAPVYDPLFEIVDIIKFDVMLSDTPTIEKTLHHLKHWPRLQLLAEKVEDQAQFDCYRNLGFSLFQGYFFAKPVIISGKKANPDQLKLMRVISQLAADIEIAHIEQTFKESPNLTVGLLRLVNSVGMGMRSKVGSVRQALVVLGRSQLQRWLQLLLYAQDNAQSASPLMQLAATRAKTMESLMQRHPGKAQQGPDALDQAFMTGILSLVDAAMGVRMEDIIDQLGLIDEVKDAVLQRKGFLGQMLALVESVEAGDFNETARLLQALELKLADINQATLAAIQWAADLDKEAD